MPDASGLPEAAPSADDQAKPDTAFGDWAPAIEQLQVARDDPKLQQDEPKLTERAERLLANIGQGADLKDPQTQTRIAYLISDIDRATEASLVLPPDLRSAVDHLAVSYPGLDHPDIQEMLRQTASMAARDSPTIRDVRVLARDYVKHDAAAGPDGTNHAIAERISVMESRVRDALAGPEAPPHAEIPEHHAVPTATAAPQINAREPAPELAEAFATGRAEFRERFEAHRRQEANQAQAQQNVQPPPARPAQAQAQSQQVQQAAGTINIPMSAASRMLDRLTQGRADGPPPWQGVTQAVSDRLAPYQQAQADRYHKDLERSVEASGKAAVKALAALDTGPAADVMRKIGQEAAKDPNGATGVIEQMRPGGKHETLRNEFNAVFAQNNGFGTAFDRAKLAVTNYLEGRDVLAENYHRRGWHVGDMDEKLKPIDRAIAGVAERVPGRESGKSLTEELAKKAMEMAEALYEKVKQAFGRVQPGVSHEAGAAASPSPSMSAAP